MKIFRREIDVETGEVSQVEMKAYRNADGESVTVDVGIEVPPDFEEYDPYEEPDLSTLEAQ